MRKILFSLLVIISLSFGLAPVAQAQEGGGGDGSVEGATAEGISAEGYVFSAADLAGIAAKDQMARDHLKEISIFGAYSRYLNVGPAETYREPEDHKYDNYCGPTSTQIVIRARKSAALVPSREAVAKGEYFNTSYGVKIYNIRPYLNKVLGTTWYLYATSRDANQFSTWTWFDVDRGYALITGLRTAGMPGWGFPTAHIVAVYGYSVDASNTMSIAYVDTASELAGHKYRNGGRYFNLAKLKDFYVWVNLNDLQVW